MTPESWSERARTWLEPISAEAPCGAPSKHHPLYEAVTAEVAKLESPTGDAVRWDDVVRGAGELLQRTSKDLWLASYFAYGLYATEGLPGALTGTTLLAELTERYWPSLYPEASRMRGRGLALSWFVERMTWGLPTAQTDSTSPAVVEALAGALARLAEVSRARLATHGPALGPLLTSLERLRASLPAEIAATPAPPPLLPTSAASPASFAEPAPPSVPTPPTTLPTPPVARELTSAEDATDFLRNLGSSLTSAAGVLRRAQPADPLAYRLLRTGLWLHLSHPPPTHADGRTSLPPLPAALRVKLETLTTHKRWSELLDESESASIPYRFVLDLQRFSLQALTALGPEYTAAREALLLELKGLLKRMPAAMELVAADGTPLTDTTTKEWLRGEVLDPPPSTPRGLTPPSLAPEVEAAPPAESLAANGSDTLAQLQGQMAAATTARARFVARLRLARRCAQEGYTSMARALYEVLDVECTAQALDAWEPALAAACLEGFLNCNRPEKDSSNALVVDFWIRYRRLVQLDPVAALRVQP